MQEIHAEFSYGLGVESGHRCLPVPGEEQTHARKRPCLGHYGDAGPELLASLMKKGSSSSRTSQSPGPGSGSDPDSGLGSGPDPDLDPDPGLDLAFLIPGADLERS